MTLGSQRYRAAILLLILAVVAVNSSSANAANTVLKFDTIIGSLHVRLLDNVTPVTAENFLIYVNEGSYNNSIFHRLARNFVLQGGGYSTFANPGYLTPIPDHGTIVNEYERSNVRGTLAMAKVGGDPHSATSEFFFNLSDTNALNLDNQNGGFTVFAYVVGDGMDIVDLLSDYYLQSPWFKVEIENGVSDGLPRLVQLDGNGNEVDGYRHFEWLNTVSVVIGVDGNSVPVGVHGDVDFDGDVDADDYNEFTASFGERGVGLAADFDGDYDVDLDDFTILQANYSGPTSPPAAPGGAVPEPASICLLGLCGMALIRKRRGKS
ncbi:MAG: peptidylprolyl isomerase [Phycisphaerae bacterium]|nr:peptidylprolyl isomerase [Phycisphaerae bacterium]